MSDYRALDEPVRNASNENAADLLALPEAARGRSAGCGGALACWSFKRGSGSRVVNLRVTGSAGPRIDAQRDRALTAFYSRQSLGGILLGAEAGSTLGAGPYCGQLHSGLS